MAAHCPHLFVDLFTACLLVNTPIQLSFQSLHTYCSAIMVKLEVRVHPKGLPPLQAMNAWVLCMEEGVSWPEIQEYTTSVVGERAGSNAVREAVARVDAMDEGALVPNTEQDFCPRWRYPDDATCNTVGQRKACGPAHLAHVDRPW